MSKPGLALAVVSHESQIRAVAKALRVQHASRVVIISEDRMSRSLTPSGVRMQVFADYVPGSELKHLHYDKLVRCGLIADEIVKKVADGDTQLSTLLGCLMPEFQTRHIDLILRSILSISRAIAVEKPDEIWITSAAKWMFPGVPRFPGSEPPPLDYSLVVSIVAARVADLNAVSIRWLPATLTEVAHYSIARWFRPCLEAINQLVYWAQKAPARWPSPQPSPSSSRGAVCFFVQARVHGERLSPIAEVYGREHSVFLRDRSLSGSRANRNLGMHDYSFVDIRGFLTQVQRSRRYKRIARRNIDRSGFMQMKGIFSYLGVDFGDILEEALYSYLGLLPDVLAYIDATDRALRWFEPVVWVTAHPRSRACQAILRVCHGRQIPTVVVQHGLTSPLDYSAPVFASRIAVMGKQTADLLESYGVPRSRISVTGMSVEEEVRHGEYSDRIGANVCPALRTGLPTVLVASELDPEMDPSADYAEAISRDLGVNVILKLHPLASAVQYGNYIHAKYPRSRVRIMQDISFASLLRASSVLIGGESTTVIEAMIAGVPAILNKNASESVYAEYAWCASSPEEAVAMVRRLLPGGVDRGSYIDWQRAGVQYFISGNDGASRVAEMIRFLSRTGWQQEYDTPASFCPSGTRVELMGEGDGESSQNQVYAGCPQS